jgi:RNA polymerase sigma-70 factor (ECF subfamily)
MTDELLVLLAQEGDREALNALLQSIQERLVRYIARLVAPAPDVAAEDVLQETLMRIARKLRWLDDVRLFDAWSYRIASRETYRALGRRRIADEIDAQLPAPEEPPPAMTWSELAPFIDRLPRASRAVVLLHYAEERTLDEAAQILDIPLGTAKSRLAYGLQRLRVMVKPP